MVRRDAPAVWGAESDETPYAAIAPPNPSGLSRPEFLLLFAIDPLQLLPELMQHHSVGNQQRCQHQGQCHHHQDRRASFTLLAGHCFPSPLTERNVNSGSTRTSRCDVANCTSQRQAVTRSRRSSCMDDCFTFRKKAVSASAVRRQT